MKENNDPLLNTVAMQNKIKEIFKTISDGPEKEARAARKELSAIYIRTSYREVFGKVLSSQMCNELLNGISPIQDPQLRAIYISALNEISYSVKKKQEHKLIELVFQEIMHPSAQVRISAVRLADRIRIFIILPIRNLDKNDNNKSAVAILARAKKLVEKHSPREWLSREDYDPIIVPKLPVSLPKSLLLLWNAFSNMGMYEEEFFKKHPECLLPFPAQFYDDYKPAEEEDFEKQSVQDIADTLWENTPIAKETRDALAKLESIADERLTNSLKKLPVDQIDLKKALREANKLESSDVLQEVFLKLSNAALKSGMHVDEMNPIVRAMQGYSNNMVSLNIQSEPYSRLLAVSSNNLPEKYATDINEMPSKIADAHKSLDQHINSLIREKKEMSAEVAESFKEITPPINNFDDTKRSNQHITRLEECRSIGHHALDWYIQLIPADLFKKQKEKVAAIALDIVSNFNDDSPVKRWMPFYRRELTELGGWKGSMGDASSSAFAAARDNIQDIDIMILRADPESDEVPFVAPQDRDSENNGSGTEHITIGTPSDQLDPSELILRMNILFERYGISDTASVEEIKKLVYESGDGARESMQEFHTKFIELFPQSELKQKESYLEVLGTSVDAWNAFPHKKLNGKSPLEMISDVKKQGE